MNKTQISYDNLVKGMVLTSQMDHHTGKMFMKFLSGFFISKDIGTVCKEERQQLSVLGDCMSACSKAHLHCCDGRINADKYS